jgi:4-hydroxy-tetrahydrodipicolinate synthase
MSDFSLICAVGTALDADELLDFEGMEAQINDQWENGMTGLLVGGTMGAMQLLSDETYSQLIDHSIACSRGRGELMIGVGDVGLKRSLQRVEVTNTRKIQGIVALSPFFIKLSQAELFVHFTAIADASKHPLYLYDLPILTGTKLELDTVARLALHPNIRGIKCSCDLGWIRHLLNLELPDFRVIVAQAEMIDALIRCGVREHLDGVFALAPHWVAAIAAAAIAGDWATARSYQLRMSALLKVLRENGVFATFSAIMNARGIKGVYAPKPIKLHSPEKIEQILEIPIVRELLRPRDASDDSRKTEVCKPLAI